MNTSPENSSNEIEANIQPGITRRTFIKRTTATAVVTALALHSFRNEARADAGGSGSDVHLSTTESFYRSGSGYSSEQKARDAAAAAKNNAVWITTEQYGPIPPNATAQNPPVTITYPKNNAPDITTKHNADGTWSYEVWGTKITYYYL